ncbi:lysosomal proton-coupled steroid conjugate and bile acid symporter SLC46A3-like [Liolophura sinensis]|uniref:lysosomal proton-coupled steroid conjugate and bile acid symporter SLC46A3-like n=1 Tax=Liolophura sinensis TaxID=3198878 RepID=UPI0031592914
MTKRKEEVRLPPVDMPVADKSVISDEKETDLRDTNVNLGRRFHVIWGVLALFVSSMMIISSTYSQYLVAHFIKEVRLEWNITEISSTGTRCEANTSSLSYTVMIESQSRAATIKMYLSMTSGIPSIVVIFLLGAFSDRVGRKVLFLLPVFGFIAMTVTYAVVSYWTLPIQFVYIGHFLEGISGGFVTFLIGMFAYTSDLTKGGNSRSLRITLVETVIAFSLGVTDVALGHVIHSWGYTIPFVVGTALLFLDAGIIQFILPESHVVSTYTTLSVKQYFYSTFYFYFSKKVNRFLFQIGGCSFFILALIGLGKPSVDILFMLNSPLCWDSVKIGYFGVAHRVSAALGGLILVTVLQRWLPDAKIAMLSTISFFLGVVVQGFAWNDILMFTSVTVGAFASAAISLVRAILSKLTPQGQHGAMFGSVAVIEAITMLTNGIVFNVIYRSTLSLFHGAVYMFMGGLLLVAVGLFIVLERGKRRTAGNENVQVVNDEPKEMKSHS